MKKNRFILALLLCITASTANAGLIVDIIENSGDILASYSGTIDLNATQGLAGFGLNGYDGFDPIFGAVGFTTNTLDFYQINVSGWTQFGTGIFGNWTTSSGDGLAMFSNPFLGLATGYTSGTVISGQASLSNASFISAGFTVGSYLTTFSNGNFSDSVTVNILGHGPTPVSEPDILVLIGLGAAGMGFARRKKMT